MEAVAPIPTDLDLELDVMDHVSSLRMSLHTEHGDRYQGGRGLNRRTCIGAVVDIHTQDEDMLIGYADILSFNYTKVDSQGRSVITSFLVEGEQLGSMTIEVVEEGVRNRTMNYVRDERVASVDDKKNETSRQSKLKFIEIAQDLVNTF